MTRAELFLTLDDAKRKLTEWKQDYNKVRPYSSLGDIPPRSSRTSGLQNNRKKSKSLT
jgi:putative transposase